MRLQAPALPLSQIFYDLVAGRFGIALDDAASPLADGTKVRAAILLAGRPGRTTMRGWLRPVLVGQSSLQFECIEALAPSN